MNTLVILFMDGTKTTVTYVKSIKPEDGVLKVAKADTAYTQTWQGFPLHNIRHYYFED